MKLISNAGDDRVIDQIATHIPASAQLNCISPQFSLFAYAALRESLHTLDSVELILPSDLSAQTLLGNTSDRPARNQLTTQWLAKDCLQWLEKKAHLLFIQQTIPQALCVLRDSHRQAIQSTVGAFALTTDGLGLSPGQAMRFIQTSQTPQEALMLSQWYDQQSQALAQTSPAEPKHALLNALHSIALHQSPQTLYATVLHHLFSNSEQTLDEESIVKSATGIRESHVWKKLYRFQRDGVVGAIDKLNRFGGCIIADSVGLGKTFEALAVIKYHELRNDRVLVLCPKRLRDNWTLYKSNDKRNILAADRLNYDVLNHTDLSRDAGSSGDIDLSHVNWGNYDLIVIDESHNFRNKSSHKGKESRYDRLMRKIIQEGVKTRVLMLSATPVNNRLADLRNQIAFATEGNDAALIELGITSIETTTRKAQAQFNRWLELDDTERSPSKLMDMIGFDYFSLLDHLTIARSRKHIEKYYGTTETGRFPTRLAPINIKADVDLTGGFRAISDINLDIRRLTLASYAPLRYILPHKQNDYDAKYNTQVRGGEGTFRQTDREENLIHLLRVNVLKRMESAVPSFALTLARQLQDVEATLTQIKQYQNALSASTQQDASIEEIDIADIDIQDPAFEPLLVGRKVKVLLSDVDLIRWQQDLNDDRTRLTALLTAAQQVTAAKDAKLAALKAMVLQKCRQPLNAGNRKIIVFTAFSDTAHYLYAQLSDWAHTELGLHSGLVTGGAGVQTNLPGLRKHMGSVLSAFAPRAKERPAELAGEGEIDLLIATDCISEGQNLQDCDWLVNYDIHWNPVRIIQRFGRIDRIGSPNHSIQLVNFWPNIALNEYINLEQRVSGRMVLLDISATGEENLIVQQSGDPMNDLEYRRKQLIQLQDSVIDMEDLSAGISITDLTLTDFRIDLAQFRSAHPDLLDTIPMGASAVTTALDADTAPGIVFCLRADAATDADKAKLAKLAPQGYPLAPHFLVHISADGAVQLPFTQVKRVLDCLKRQAQSDAASTATAEQRQQKATQNGKHMAHAQHLLASAIASVLGKSTERAIASLFTPGGTHAIAGDVAGSGDFEVLAYLVILPNDTAPAP